MSELFMRCEPYKDENWDETKIINGHRPNLDR